jgi:hypothetical protein
VEEMILTVSGIETKITGG